MKKYLFLLSSVLFVISFICSCGHNENVDRISSFQEATVTAVNPEKSPASSDSDVAYIPAAPEISITSEAPPFSAHHIPEPVIPKPVNDVIADKHVDDSKIVILGPGILPNLRRQPEEVLIRVRAMYRAAVAAVESMLSREQMRTMSTQDLFNYGRRHLVEIINTADLNGYSKNYFCLAHQFALYERSFYRGGDTVEVVIKVFDIKTL